MGFGILLFGYLFLTNVEVAVNAEHQIGFDVLPDFIGFIIMFYALSMLSTSYSAFKTPQKAIYPLFITSLILLLCQGISFFNVFPSVVSKILSIVIPLQSVILAFFHITLFKTVKELASEIDLASLAGVSKRCIVFSTIFYIGYPILLYVLPNASKLGAIAPFFNLTFYIFLLFQYFVLFYNILALYKCYMYIGYEGEDTLMNVKHPLQSLVDKLKK